MYVIIFLIIFFVVAFLCKLIVKHLSYWKRNGIPQYSVVKILKETFDVLIQNKSQLTVFRHHQAFFQNYRYFGVYQLFQKILVVKDAELIKKITVKDFDHFSDHAFFDQGEPLWDQNLFALRGMEWKEMRTIINPTFTSRKMKIMFESSLNYAKDFVDYFQKMDKQTCVLVDAKDAFTRYFIDIIGLLNFGYEGNSLKDPDNEFYVNSKLVLPSHSFIDMVRRFFVFNLPRVAKFFGFGFFPKVGGEFFLNIILNNMKVRERDGIVRNDIIQLLIEAKKSHNNKNLTDLGITSQAILFFFAGVDTVSTFMACTLYELAVDANIQKRLQEEVDKTVTKCNGLITYFALDKMEYMNMVVSECLRKWPPLVIDRVCTKPYLIEPENENENPVYLQKGDVVWIPIYSFHRNPDIFPNPDRFDPERFSNENKSNLHKYAFIPFGSGPRNCIAYRFALMEIKLIIVHILSNFDIILLDNAMDPGQSSKMSGLTIAVDHLWLGFKSRTKEF